MSRRNFILLLIILIIVTISALLFLYFKQPTSLDGEDGGGFFQNLNPFSGVKDVPPNTTPSDNTPDTTDTTTPDNVQERILMKVSTMPIAGFTVFQKEKVEKEFVPALRYVARATGYIYQTLVEEIVERRFSNTIIPKVYEAVLGNNGEAVVMRYLKSDEQTIQTFLGTLPKEKLGEEPSGNEKIEGSFLPDNISDLSLSYDGTKIFYLLNTSENVSGITLNLSDNKKTQVFDSRFTEWLSFWPNSKMITLTTKPSGTATGYMYAVDPSRKDLNRILDNINGLMTLTSPNGKLVLYSNSGLALNVYDIESRSSNSLGLRTVAEKCVWGKGSDVVYCAIPKLVSGGIYPDRWHKGETSFSDEIWKINIESGVTTKLIDPISVAGGEEVDGIKLMLDNNEDYLFFVNKKDSYLWKLDLE
ncbi:hypothetical protein COU49_01425 [Candidatus Nomurabacteria bacterium CG10_big_fil_rev_8_21_14_0_10_35_16]|uniref:Uncharacterized protein n=1 Tax=Candidatus Nomurabacteria bacterium CG10_big_fil_rev_8_21_14_0_10_35_16 TaxID=1974731 RepID=A0A2H0TBF7_9BACT|nr:MAG: hypothetical protein COU49_01425 [Candidatus Nomurabacteria bacterium CG10_big_fil_rev_8_21_14_0_10_35_16]